MTIVSGFIHAATFRSVGSENTSRFAGSAGHNLRACGEGDQADFSSRKRLGRINAHIVARTMAAT